MKIIDYMQGVAIYLGDDGRTYKMKVSSSLKYYEEAVQRINEVGCVDYRRGKSMIVEGLQFSKIISSAATITGKSLRDTTKSLIAINEAFKR